VAEAGTAAADGGGAVAEAGTASGYGGDKAALAFDPPYRLVFRYLLKQNLT